jgi:hypothetical protein
MCVCLSVRIYVIQRLYVQKETGEGEEGGRGGRGEEGGGRERKGKGGREGERVRKGGREGGRVRKGGREGGREDLPIPEGRVIRDLERLGRLAVTQEIHRINSASCPCR